MYGSNDYKTIEKKQKIITILKKICICLIIVNFGMIRLKFFSPKTLKIFYDKNKFIVNIVYSILALYVAIYFFIWGIEFYQIKKITKKYNQLK